MTDFLSNYLRLEPPTWVFLSTFLAIGLFLMFHRFWSLRNLDIVLILLFTPGLMMVFEGSRQLVPSQVEIATQEKRAETETASGARQGASESGGVVETAGDGPSAAERAFQASLQSPTLLYFGYLWLIIVASLLVIRLLLDTAIVRRPMLDPNLSSGGMLFLGTSMLVYLLVNVAVSQPSYSGRDLTSGGPGYILMAALPDISTVPMSGPGDETAEELREEPKPPSRLKLLLSRCMSIGANLVMVLSIVAIGYWHFGNFKTGVGAATLYLLLPYTAYMTGRVDHVVPSALLLLAVLLYRQPFAAGLCLGCAAGVVYYPFSLLPLWCSFYWQRGIRRFTGGFVTSIVGLVVAMIILHPNNVLQHLGYMFGIKQIAMTGMDGIWGLGWYPVMRIPLIVIFVLLSISFVAWPAQKSLATLMSCSAALMAATQCWHGFGGGLYLAWFVPLALLTIFRPNLDYCVALEVVRPRRRKPTKVTPPIEKASAA
ncbi:hypothetical protein SH467x_001855 [Pirellulaceae bacterium SH467]|jgi:hypothetical protein